jgi:hypothetical protein
MQSISGNRKNRVLNAGHCAAAILVRIFHRFSPFDRTFSLTPSFSWASRGSEGEKPFQRFSVACETVKTVSDSIFPSGTQLKLGVNEKKATTAQAAKYGLSVFPYSFLSLLWVFVGCATFYP